MSEPVNIHAAKTHFSRLVERAHAGEEIVIAKAGKPYAKLVPIRTGRPKRIPGRFRDRFSTGEEIFEPLPDEELRLWAGRRD